jgi:photosynthetic reaction center cytochrome c subunit
VNVFAKATGGLIGVLLLAGAVSTYKKTSAFQMGAPGVGMEVIKTRQQLSAIVEANVVPPALPPADTSGQLAVDAYKNVQVLGHLPSGEFTRLMTAMAAWVAPDNGCGYCHAPQRDAKGVILKDDDGYALADPNNMQSDELYTKVVARRMLQMVMHINGDWKAHVKQTGVTCYTCHRGNPVPKNIWFDEPENPTAYEAVGFKAGQNAPTAVADYSSLPGSSLRPFLAGDANVRVQSTEAVGSDNLSSIKQTEWTYSLMTYMSNSLGVNCTYCHNSRSFGDWSESPEARTTAWHGIRMVRDLNGAYLEPLAKTLPKERLGPAGDGPKVGCATCHAGAYKPLLGVSMLSDYSVLAMAKPQPSKTPVAVTEAPDAGASSIDGVPPETGSTTTAPDAGSAVHPRGQASPASAPSHGPSTTKHTP